MNIEVINILKLGKHIKYQLLGVEKASPGENAGQELFYGKFKFEGGKTTIENCQMLCKNCNRVKSGK